MTAIPEHTEDQAFQAAVAWAVSQLLNAKAVAPELFEADGLEKIDDLEAGLQALTGDGSGLVLQARTDWRAYRALELGCARFVRNAWDLPKWATDWIADHLEGKIARPTRPRGPYSKAGLHHLICECVEALIGVGMVGVRNDATERRSACDVLAEALRLVGLQPSTFEGVKRVFVNCNKQQDEIERLRKTPRIL